MSDSNGPSRREKAGRIGFSAIALVQSHFPLQQHDEANAPQTKSTSGQQSTNHAQQSKPAPTPSAADTQERAKPTTPERGASKPGSRYAINPSRGAAPKCDAGSTPDHTSREPARPEEPGMHHKIPEDPHDEKPRNRASMRAEQKLHRKSGRTPARPKRRRKAPTGGGRYKKRAGGRGKSRRRGANASGARVGSQNEARADNRRGASENTASAPAVQQRSSRGDKRDQQNQARAASDKNGPKHHKQPADRYVLKQPSGKGRSK